MIFVSSLLFFACILLTLPARAQLIGQFDYAKTTGSLNVNGRDIPIKFGAALIGYQEKLESGWSVSGHLGRGYDPKVSASFLNADASGPAICDVLNLRLMSPSLTTGERSLQASLDYRTQRVEGHLNGTYQDGPFRGEVVLRTHYLTPALGILHRYESGTSSFFRFGFMHWTLHYQAYGEVERAKIWTQSRVKGWDPVIGLGTVVQLSSVTLVTQFQAYRLSSDNKVWAPGLSVTVLK